SSQAVRIRARACMRCVTAGDTREGKPRMRAPHAVLSVAPPDKWPVATAHAVRMALTMTNVTEPAIRRVIQPIVRCVGEARDKEYGMKIIDAKFRPTGAIDSRP